MNQLTNEQLKEMRRVLLDAFTVIGSDKFDLIDLKETKQECLKMVVMLDEELEGV